jgi:DNA-binding PadR family transcriptional regulator
MEWTDGMLYPVLHRLERKGQIKSRWAEAESGRKRKYYSLKQDGKKALEEHHENWAVVNSVLTGLRKEQYV